jgi:LPS O-antigen subunit length determinant protein (WzzB/FepE family)
MKLITILGGIVIVGIGVLYAFPSTQEYVVERIVEVPKVETVDALEVRIKEAQEGAQASTTAKAQEAYEEVITKENVRIELEIRKAHRKELETKEIELEKQSGF